jgi:ABC-type anion transport system duplicated permease subunit
LLVFKGANPAAIWTIFICSIWPMIINTAVGVQRVPQDYMNVARVLNLSEWKDHPNDFVSCSLALHVDWRSLGRWHCVAGDRRC